jgi:hypothetical protein
MLPNWRLQVDISPVVIEQMRRAHCDMPELVYEVADCRSMPQHGTETFGSVLDKGTLDAVLCWYAPLAASACF